MKKIAFLIFLVLIITGCVHHSPFDSEYFFQAMGKEAEVVVTVDASALKEEKSELNENAVFARTDRVSVALDPKNSDIYPLPIEDWNIYGALEGNFGTLLVPAVIDSMDGFDRVRGTDEKYYSNGKINIGVPENGILLFSTSDYEKVVSDTIENRTILIPSEIANAMAEPLMAFYVNNPKTMISLGFDLPLATLTNISYALLTISVDNGVYYLSALIEFENERNAGTFTTLLRNMVVQEIRRSGGSLDFKALSQMIRTDGTRTIVENKELKSEEVDRYFNMALSLQGGVI